MSEGVQLTVCVVEALDHFTTDEELEESEVIIRFIGEVVDETKHYLVLRSIKADTRAHDSGENLHFIIKSAIVRQKDVPIQFDGEK